MQDTCSSAAARRRGNLPVGRAPLTLQKVGNAPPVLGITESLRVTAQTAGQATSFSYDANGNTTLEEAPGGTTTFTWDTENRLTSVNAAGSVETYTYDGSTSVPGKVTGRRRTKTNAAGTTYFVWDGQNVLAELDASLTRLAQYTDFPGRWGGLTSRRTAGGVRYYGFDLSANMRTLLDDEGLVEAAVLYSAFGPLLSRTMGQPYGFGAQVGYCTDEPRRLCVRARHLDVQTGRWLSADQAGLSVGVGPAVYSRNEPVRLVDPSGNWWVCCWLGLSCCNPPKPPPPPPRPKPPKPPTPKAPNLSPTVASECGLAKPGELASPDVWKKPISPLGTERCCDAVGAWLSNMAAPMNRTVDGCRATCAEDHWEVGTLQNDGTPGPSPTLGEFVGKFLGCMAENACIAAVLSKLGDLSDLKDWLDALAKGYDPGGA